MGPSYSLTHLPIFLAGEIPFVSQHAGNTAVCVFFVLSGFVMRYVTVTRVTTGRAYWIDRVSRMYSVVIPALLFTVRWSGARRGMLPSSMRTLPRASRGETCRHSCWRT